MSSTRHWLSPLFYGHLFVGWFVATMFFSLLVAVIGSEAMTDGEGWIVAIGIQILSLLSGYAHARHYMKPVHAEPRGFPVVTPPRDVSDS